MSQIVPTQNGWIDTDPFGMKQAQQIGLQLRQQANADQEFKTQQILDNQKLSVNDIMNHLNLAKVANPIDASGNVATPGTPATLNQTTSQPDEGNAVQDSSTLDQLRNLPAQQMGPQLDPTGNTLPQQQPTPPPGAPSSGGDLNSQLLNLPQTRTSLNPGTPAGTRPADPTRTVTYSDGQGNQSQYEIKNPDDLAAVDAASARAKFQATAVPMKIDAATQKSMGVSLPDQIWVDPDHLAQYMTATGQAQQVPTSAAAQAAGLPATVPLKNLAQVVQVMNNQNTVSGANTRNQTTNDTRSTIADNAQTGAGDRNAATNATRLKVAADNNATTIQAKNITREQFLSGGGGTPGQQGVQNRFMVRQQAAQQKSLQAVQAQEDQVHAVRTQLGEDLKNPAITDAQKTAKLAQLKTTAYQVQSYQTRKASILGATPPPKAVQDAIPEGTQGPAPDGHIWRKQGGIVYLVQ